MESLLKVYKNKGQITYPMPKGGLCQTSLLELDYFILDTGVGHWLIFLSNSRS